MGLAGGVVVAAVAGARRTSTAYDRFLDHSRAADVAVGVGPEFQGTPPFDRIRRLPMVETAGTLSYVFMTVDGLGPDELVVPFAAGDRDQYRAVERGIVAAGRRPDPSRADEIAISPGLQRRHGWRPGTRVRVQLANGADVQQALSGKEFFPLEGPRVSLRVAGVLRQPEDLTTIPDNQRVVYLGGALSVYLTPAFFDAHVRRLFGEPVGMRLRLRNGPADIDAFRRAVGAMPEARGVGVEEATLKDAQARGAIDLQASALLVFAVLAGLALFVIAGQSLARHVWLDAGDHGALRALGMSNAQIVGVAGVHGAVIGAAGAAGAAVTAALLSPFAVFGLARQAEPVPGFDLDVAVLAGGAAAIALICVARAAAAGVRSAREISHRSSSGSSSRVPSPIARVVRLVGASPAAAAGVRIALAPQRGPASVPVSSSLAGTIVAIAALVASVGFGASLQQLASSPSSYGWNWDVIVGNPNNVDTMDEVVPTLAASPAVGSFSPLAIGTEIRVGGAFAPVLGVDVSHGAVFPVMTEGAPPAGPDEIALGTRVARRLRLGVGDTVEVTAAARRTRMRVSGITVRGGDQTPGTIAGGSPGEGAIVRLDALRSLAPEAPVNLYLVRFAPDADPAAALLTMRNAFPAQVLLPIRPTEIENVVRIGWIPYALAGVLALLGLATLAHTLVTAVRRRAVELAVLKSVGFVRRQVSATVAWHASATIAVALLIGIPLGVTGGRWSWRIVSDTIGVPFRSSIPPLAIAAGAAVALLLANAIAAVPGAMAARIAPAAVLRQE